MKHYTKFQLRCIELNLCIACGDESANRFRRCLKCRQRRNAALRIKRSRPAHKPDALCHPVTVWQRRRERDRAAGRGYWPEIHGRV